MPSNTSLERTVNRHALTRRVREIHSARLARLLAHRAAAQLNG
jgi:hypothetical protein